MKVDYWKLNQVVALLAATELNGESSWEQMSTDSATWNVAIDLANRFFPYSSEKQTRNICIHLGWTIVTLMDLLQS